MEQDSIIENAHIENNHRGINEMFEHVKRSVYFPNLKQKINAFVNQCEICKLHKYERNPPKIEFNITQTPKLPLEICHVDIFFFKKNEPILTIIDKFSRYAQAYILESRNTPHIKSKLMQFFSLFGKPKLIITDQERACTTIDLKDFLAQNNIDLHFASINSSNSNSTVERLHSTLAEHLRIIVNTEKTTTECALFKALHAYNNSINSITKFAPFELFFGRKFDEPLEPDIRKIKEKKITMQTEALIASENRKTQYINMLNENREKPMIMPKDIYARQKTVKKTQARNRKIHIQRQKKLNVYDFADLKYHKNKINRPRKLLLQQKPRRENSDADSD